eukprot:3937128-Rhodomonas_salina.1
MRLAAAMCSGPGFDIKREHTLNAMSGRVRTTAYISPPTSCWYFLVASGSGVAGDCALTSRVPGSDGVGAG